MARTGTPRGTRGGRGRGPARAGARRPRSRAVFWRRRIIALVVVAAVVAGVGWGFWKVFGILGDAWDEAVAAQQATPTDISTAQPVACPPDELEWGLSHDAGVAGERVRFALTVTNASETSCLVDAGAQNMVLTVVSGEDRIWSTADCGSAEAVRLLLGPGDETTRAVTWNGTRSAPGCTAVDSAVLPGTYQLGMTYDGLDVPGAAAVFPLR